MKFITEQPYEYTDFVWIISHYDIHLDGLCRFNGEICYFRSIDNTDYQEMSDNCPYCSDKTDDMSKCVCEAHVDLVCNIFQLTWLEKIKYLLKKKTFEFCVGKHWSYPNRRYRESFTNKRPFLCWLYYRLKGFKTNFPKK